MFSIGLRQQLESATVKVFEFIPTMIDTKLDKGTRKARKRIYFGIMTADLVTPT